MELSALVTLFFAIYYSMLADKLNMSSEDAEKWIVNLIRNARLDAKIDSQLVSYYITMGGQGGKTLSLPSHNHCIYYCQLWWSSGVLHHTSLKKNSHRFSAHLFNYCSTMHTNDSYPSTSHWILGLNLHQLTVLVHLCIFFWRVTWWWARRQCQYINRL